MVIMEKGMKKRKLIGVITVLPECTHAQRVLSGVFEQCEKYGYDVAVFAPMTTLSHSYEVYRKGELNIWELINFELLDGVIVDTISLINNGDETIKDAFCKKLETECKKPVVSLDFPLGDYPVAKSSNNPVFYEIMEHVLDYHGKKKVCFLTGPERFEVSRERLRVCLEEMRKRNLEIKPEWIVYGDFWYSSGYVLGERIVKGEIPRPEAVVCASDHMAIGVVNYLVEHGIRVPEDIIVTGFEGFQEAALNFVSVTSFESNEALTAANGMDILYNLVEPGKPLVPMDMGKRKHIHTGMSCGCEVDFVHSARAFRDSFYFLYHDYHEGGKVDIGQLMEEYVAEFFAEAENPHECIKNINNSSYFLKPYSKFCLCLKEDWLEPDNVVIKGYPEKMKLAICNGPTENEGFYREEDSFLFDTKLMLPYMLEDSAVPMVYYFSPVHFRDKVLGYAVLQRKLTEKKKINLVYRNWLRYVNSALEMIQTKSKLLQLSISDPMTGALNRRGMSIEIKRMLEEAREGDFLFAAVIDMDGLKYVNDTFGHAEGDFGIKQVYRAVLLSSRTEEICVRAGGDEFYVLGRGKYSEDEYKKREEAFEFCLNKINEEVGKPYLISASLGMEIARYTKDMNVENLINEADIKMYTSKLMRKKQRI